MADAPTPTAPAAQGGTAPNTPDGDDGKGGKAAILADLATERDKRQALEGQIQQLQAAQQTQTDALAKAFGLKPEETSDVATLAAQVTALKEQFTTTQHTNAVLAVANKHGITDPGDLALLGHLKDETAMTTLAARIAQTPSGEVTTAPGPRPDLSQGGKGGAGATGDPAQDFAKFMGDQLGR